MTTYQIPSSALLTQTIPHDIVVFSHLRWEFVTQRPQHLIRRLAKKRTILFVEEPVPHTPETYGTAHTFTEGSSITILQPRIAYEHMSEELPDLISTWMHALDISNPIMWLYSPSFIDVVTALPRSLMVYDCMDELAAFKGASKELLRQEKKLMRLADVVFTGGKSLYESKKQHHANVHCFPSSVDEAHFKKAKDETTPIPTDIKAIPRPQVGYIGVIDERIDTVLLAQMAAARPDVSFVMIGPVVKIDEADLPHAPNIHYLGGKKYEELPMYQKSLDIAMMPFALNSATQFISPTKTLEYIAAGKPIISTPVYDVVRDYAKDISIVSNPDDFSKSIDMYATETKEEKAIRERKYAFILERTSWDKTAASMENHMRDAYDIIKSGPEEIESPYGYTRVPAYALGIDHGRIHS